VTVPEPVLCRIEPIFSPRLWGARSLAPFFPDKTNLKEPLGEAWLTGSACQIANGPFMGKTLGGAWRSMPEEWRGTQLARYSEFPLLVKFIFPTDKLSIQVHPSDSYAAKYEQAAGGRGKTEMWHIVSSQPGAQILLGLKPGVTKQDFLDALANHTVEELLIHRTVQPGDTYFVSAGTQHAIGPNMVICEVQEYSDLTYRVYDFGRLDSSGKPRELHIEKALEVTNFDSSEGCKVPPLALHSPDANKHLLAACEFFATERWDCRKTTFVESDREHFQLIVILAGNGRLYDAEEAFDYRAGEAWFLPATLPVISLQPTVQTSLLRVFVPERDSLFHQLRNQGFDDRAIAGVLRG
jgi:mannose-6-phosphate isomerase